MRTRTRTMKHETYHTYGNDLYTYDYMVYCSRILLRLPVWAWKPVLIADTER